jgi:tRNA(fMet)-specific endonuclease VapC
MALTPVLLDTDVLSAIMRREPAAVKRAQAYLREHREFAFSVITRYEISRGLAARAATKQAAGFDRFCAANVVLPVTNEVAVKAAAVYADLRAQGQLIGDADILIAATGLVHGFGVATNNEDHFKRVAGLHVQNWLK